MFDNPNQKISGKSSPISKRPSFINAIPDPNSPSISKRPSFINAIPDPNSPPISKRPSFINAIPDPNSPSISKRPSFINAIPDPIINVIDDLLTKYAEEDKKSYNKPQIRSKFIDNHSKESLLISKLNYDIYQQIFENKQNENFDLKIEELREIKPPFNHNFTRPQTVNEIFIGDVFENIQPLENRVSDYPLIAIVNVDKDRRIAYTNTSEMNELDWCVLLDPMKYRRIVNSKPKTPFFPELSFDNDIEYSENPQFIGKSAKNGFFQLLRRANLSIDNDFNSDARRIFFQACNKYRLIPLPIIVRCIQDKGGFLDLSNQVIGPEYGDCLSEALSSMTFLIGINLTSNSLDSISVIKIFESLKRSNINSLILDKNKFGKVFIKKFIELLKDKSIDKGFPIDIQNLSLNQCNVGSKGITDFFNNIKVIKSFQSLCLKDNQISYNTSLSISNYLKSTSSNTCPLLHLDLSWNNLGNEGCGDLLRAISTPYSLLEVLVLDWNGLNDNFVKDINLFIISSNRALHILSIMNNIISQNGASNITNTKHNLEVKFYSSDI